MKISVIVPVYNVEKYLKRCLDSLVNQTLKEIEIIVVNDGSPDESEKIILEYLEKYRNIKYYKKENAGLSVARNYGISKSSGEYIAFVDSDDYVDTSMLQKMYEKAKEKDYDVVACSVSMVLDDGKYISTVKTGLKNDNSDIKENMITIYPSAWNKIYKKELFDKVLFKKNVWFEDVEFLYRLFPYINNIGIVNESLYYYVQRDGAITKTYDKRLYDYIKNWNSILEFYKNNNFYDEYKKELEYCYVRYLYATFIKRSINLSKKEFDSAVLEARSNVEKNFKNYRKNKYFYKSLKGIYLILFNKYLANIYYKISNIKKK